ncbi:MAG: DNA polymerase, partial [Bacillota bacterium]|nr:DNA polymerase [Bacillota bacterium]
NLPQNHIKELDDTRALLRRGDYEALEIIYDNPAIALSQLIRTAFIPSEGCRFIVADFSAIEARVIAWLAGEQWRMDVFNSHGKIYEASAAAMFGVPVESIGRGDPLRQKGKIAELALGYGGSVGALKQMGALDMGLEQGELKPLVDQWRAANPAIIGFWSDVEEAALEAVRERRTVKLQHGITFEIQAGFLFIRLPSGRRMAYARPRIAQNRFGRDAVIYEGMNQVTRKWEATETYGGKLVENIVQATARDCLAESMQLLDKAGYQIVMHVHDEVVLDVPQHQTDALSDVLSLMSKRPAWAPDLPLRADGYECPYYQKD